MTEQPAARDPGRWHEDYTCKHCGRAVTVGVGSAWPEKCPHCGTWRPTLIVKVGGATVAAGRTEP